MPPLEVLRAAVDRRLPAATSPQMVSSADALAECIVELTERGFQPRAIYDRLWLDDRRGQSRSAESVLDGRS